MKSHITRLLLPAALSLALMPSVQAQEMNETDKLSYALGMDIGASIKNLGSETNLDVFMSAIRTVIDGGELKLDPAQAAEVKKAFFAKQQEAAKAKATVAAAGNQAEGEAYLAINKEKEGMTTTDSGLQYEVITEGTGDKPSATDKVSVHYRGSLIDGTEFDSSYSRGEPTSFPVNGVIKGWTEALQLMSVGSKYKLHIPSELAYGERGAAGGRIGPNAALVFEVELLEIVK